MAQLRLWGTSLSDPANSDIFLILDQVNLFTEEGWISPDAQILLKDLSFISEVSGRAIYLSLDPYWDRVGTPDVMMVKQLIYIPVGNTSECEDCEEFAYVDGWLSREEWDPHYLTDLGLRPQPVSMRDLWVAFASAKR